MTLLCASVEYRIGSRHLRRRVAKLSILPCAVIQSPRLLKTPQPWSALMDDDVSTFGSWLRRRRQALHLTQQQLGELARCAGETIRKYEVEERRPSADVARLLAVALHLPEAEHAAFVRFARGERADAPPIPALNEQA